MAYSDYQHCDVCDCKAFYDADVCWVTANTGVLVVLCKECAKTHEIKVVPKEPPKEES